MASYGYQSDHVNLIADNLRDRYKSGFPILKELIQNADDAKARRLVFGMHSGLEGRAAHTLLQGPGLWVFNDGEFKKDDERAIRSFGLNSKAGESGSIGKFGLGMKSVFHLCEAFFYVASDGQNNFDVLLNPWRDPDSEDIFHGAWDNVEARDFEALRSLVLNEQLNKGCTSWFLMWIPLRRRTHVPQKEGKPYGGIVDKYPGDGGSVEMQFLTDGKLSRKIRSVVPLLRNLVSIELASSVQNPGFKVHIDFDDGSRRVDHLSAELVSTGSVNDGGPGKGKLRFRVQQKAVPGAQPFSQFQKLDAWPKTGRLNSHGIREPVPDKSEAEGAVMVSGAAADGDEAKLVIDWAVFLPMEDGLSYEFRLEKSLQQYRIVLHGQFFVDAGRRGIAGFGHLADTLLPPTADIDDADLHIGWNQAVAQQVILPQLLPTLAEFAKGLNESEKEELTRAVRLAKSKSSTKVFWDSFKDFVCHEQAWVRLITPEGLRWSLEKIDSDSRLLKLPRPPKHDLQRTWKVLPRLKNLVESGCLLIDEDAPSLMRTHSDWDAVTLLDILDGADYAEACSETGMSYLINFLTLEQRRYVNGSEVQRKLTAMLRLMLQRESIQVFRSMRSTFLDLVSLVKPEYRFAVGTKTAGAITGLDEATLQLLFNANVEKVVLPMDLDPDKGDSCKGVPNDDEIRSLLKVLDHEVAKQVDRSQSSKQVENLLRASQFVFELVKDKDDRGQAVRVNRSFRVLTAICARTDASRAVSFEDLQIANRRGLVFKQGFGASAYSAATELSILLPHEQIWVVSADISGWLFQKSDPSSSIVPLATDASAAYSALGKRGQALVLSDIGVRCRFVRKIIPTSINGDEIVRGLRYVLHGSSTHHEDMESTLWINADRTDEVWTKLKCMVEPDSWSVIDSNLAATLSLNSNDREKLGIRNIGPDEIIAHLSESGDVTGIDAGRFSEIEISKILSRISNEKLWISIPLHKDINGNFGSIDQNCFIDPDQLSTGNLLGDLRNIAICSDKWLREKQIQWIQVWSHKTTIEQLISRPNPQVHWAEILESINTAGIAAMEGIPTLRSKQWLPLANGGAISPEDVIDLELLVEDIDRLASQCKYCYAGVLAIAPEVQNNKQFSNIRPLFASGKFGLQRLGLLMAEAGGHSIGAVTVTEMTGNFLDCLASVNALPAWAIVRSAVNAVGIERVSDVFDWLVKEIQDPLPVDKLIDVLNEISQGKLAKQRDAFNLYLEQLAQDGNQLASALDKIKLLSKDGSWMPANKLCVGVQGAAKGSVLHDDQARILRTYLDVLGSKLIEQNVLTGGQADGGVSMNSANSGKAQSTLVDYFKPWRELMPSAPIGAFFALLGPSFRDIAVEWLKPHSFEYLLDQLSWNDPRSRNSVLWDYQRPEPSKIEAIGRLEFTPVVSSAKEIRVLSLLGTEITVPIDKHVDGLMVGNLNLIGKRANNAHFELRLRDLPHPEEYEKSELSNMLRKTCEGVLREAYNQREPNLSQLWTTLEKSNQLELAVARGLILNRLPYDLRNFRSAKKNEVLAKWQRNFNQLENILAEKLEITQTTDQVERDIAEAKKSLAALMKSDRTVQESVLSGIRQKVEQNKYQISSIAFELLQNADDAVTELQSLMRGESAVAHPPEHVGRFVMQSSGDVVRFLHWGRPINFMGHGAARQESYGGDLQRMLVLAASDKDDTVGLTGKFGLGFKSVLLATDAPCILSGDLKIKIVGGCLPIKWEAAGGALDALLDVEPKVHGLRGTVVEFKLSEPLRQSEVLDRFASLAGLQCIFSKEIRSIQVNTETHHWSPTPLALDLQNIEIGSADLPFKGSLNRANLINFRTGSGCFALHLGSRGFIRFPVGAEHSPPAIWVTAPTRESAAQGLILNNEFELDTGRGGLPHGESAQSNLVLAEKMAMGAADLVHKATRRSRDNWEDTKSRLNLVDGVSPSEFWTTFWDQIPTRKQDDDNGESNRLLSHFGSCLLDRYLMIAAEIPNGLSGSLSKFVKAADVCLILNSRWEKLHAVLAAWPAFVSHYPMSGWISANVATQLKAATGNGGLNAVDMSVRLALDMVPEKRCSSDLIATLNDLFSELTLEEAEVVQDQMSGFEFQVKNGKDGNWNFGRNLLKSGGALDKQCLPFAPATHHLNPSYKGPSLKLLQDYAPFQQPQASTLASWILSAPPEPLAARIAGLKFLLGNPEVQLYVRIGLTGSWIDGLKPASVYLADFSIQEKNQIFGMFNAAPTWSEPVPELDESTPLDGQVALEAIRDWWRAEKETHLKKFYLHFWPSNIARRFESDADSRSSWMTLFAIGLMQRHGRTQDFQNRGFIDKMQSKGFWEVFCQTDPRQNGQAWLNVLNEYGEQQIEDEQYSMWMDNFPRLYRIARWFEVYVQVFQGLDYRKKSNVSGFLSPSADPEMSGSGIHAPTMRGSLRLGQHVVVRELLRSGALKGEAAISLAFKPGESVKQFLSGIGFPDLAEQATTSQKIHSVLVEHLGDDATFDGAYDIPLIILSRDPALQQKVLGDLVAFKGEFNGE